MNGAVFDSTFNIFFKLKYAKLYDAMLATPLRVGDIALGEISWALLRGRHLLGGVPPGHARDGRWSTRWWALLALPGARC